ncbi:hypothetical protein KA013_02440 [Patescibacteria group bacterium]|nr:hypothetical protein [Patescibacteria group bacterium]
MGLLEHYITCFVAALQAYHKVTYGQPLDVQTVLGNAQKYIDQPFKFENRLKVLEKFHAKIDLATPQLQK